MLQVGDQVKFESSGYTKYGTITALSRHKYGGHTFTLAIVQWQGVNQREEPVFADQLTLLAGEPLEW